MSGIEGDDVGGASARDMGVAQNVLWFLQKIFVWWNKKLKYKEYECITLYENCGKYLVIFDCA